MWGSAMRCLGQLLHTPGWQRMALLHCFTAGSCALPHPNATRARLHTGGRRLASG